MIEKFKGKWVFGMIYKKVRNLILILIAAAILVWIFFNPYVDNEVKSEKLTNIVNDFFNSLKLNYRFKSADFSIFMRASEYFLLGVIAVIITNIYSKITFKNIIMVLFFGLFASVAEIYVKFLSHINVNVGEIVMSFVLMCLGMTFCAIISGIGLSKGGSSKYKAKKYDRRR